MRRSLRSCHPIVLYTSNPRVIASEAKQSRCNQSRLLRRAEGAPRNDRSPGGALCSAPNFGERLQFGAGDGLLALQLAQFGQQPLALGALGARDLVPEARQVALDR